MDIVYRLQGVEFEWDSNKAQSNIEKHGVTFEEATLKFYIGQDLRQDLAKCDRGSCRVR